MDYKQIITTTGLALVAGVLAAFVAVWLTGPKALPSGDGFVSAAGNLLAENYEPYVMYNGGYNSAKDIFTSAALKSTGSFQLGSSGTAQVNSVVTTCSMTANVSITASSTGYAFCSGVTGVTSSDYVLAGFSTSTAVFLVGDQWIIQSARASTTAGVIDFSLLNLTGGTAVPSLVSRIGSTTVIRAGR